MKKLLVFCMLFIVLFSYSALAADPSEIEKVLNPRHSSDKSEVVAKTSGFSEGDFEIVDGKVVIKKLIAETIAKKLLQTDNIEVVPLPWFEATVQSGNIAAVNSVVREKYGTPLIGEEKLLKKFLNKELYLLNVLSPNTGEFMEYVSPSNYDDGKFSFSTMTTVAVVGMDEIYNFVSCIRDGGRFDLEKAVNGIVVGQLAIVGKVKPGNGSTDPTDPTDTTDPKDPTDKKDPTDIKDPKDIDTNSGGGCNAAYGSILLLLTVFGVIGINKKGKE